VSQDRAGPIAGRCGAVDLEAPFREALPRPAPGGGRRSVTSHRPAADGAGATPARRVGLAARALVHPLSIHWFELNGCKRIRRTDAASWAGQMATESTEWTYGATLARWGHGFEPVWDCE